MPALVHFNRKWLIASDDFVIPLAIEAVLRLIWLTASVLITWIDIPGCHDVLFIKYFFYTFTGQFFVATSLCIAISVISSRGSVLQIDQRIHLHKILYAKCATVIIDLGLLSFGIWILFGESNLCFQWRTFLEVSVACLSLYMFAFMIGIFICYNCMGSSFYWNTKSTVNPAKLLKKIVKVWRFRLKCFCCCANVNEDEDDFAYVEISSFLYAFSVEIDLVPTDILAGLVTVCKKHAILRRKFKLSCERDTQLDNKPKPSWMTAENALYYLRIAKSTYGWFAFFDPLYPWKLCSLLSPSRCLRGLFQDTNAKQGDPFYCDISAVEKISGLSDSDVLYTSFSNSIYEPAFIVTFDHAKKAVIIAIRGTCSFSDMITDMDGDEMNLEIGTVKVKCHRGALRSALFILKKTDELQVLRTAFAENPTYTLVLTGHSLGGSIASILGLLLREEYPSLQCYCYAPLPVFSENGIEITFDIAFSVVTGDDMVPRLSFYSCKELIRQIHASLGETELPKYKILMGAFWHSVKKSLKSNKKILTSSEVYENKQVEIKDEAPAKEVQIDITPCETQLYAPGRILYLNRSNGFDYSWVTGSYFQNIIISPRVMKDHQPHQIQVFLEKYKSAFESSQLPSL